MAIPVFLLCACSNKEKKEEPKKSFSDTFTLSKYVYIDNSGCLHVAKDCLVLTFGGDENEKPNYQVKFVETKRLNSSSFRSMCSKCVSDKSFEEIKSIVGLHDIYPGAYEENDSAM